MNATENPADVAPAQCDGFIAAAAREAYAAAFAGTEPCQEVIARVAQVIAPAVRALRLQAPEEPRRQDAA